MSKRHLLRYGIPKKQNLYTTINLPCNSRFISTPCTTVKAGLAPEITDWIKEHATRLCYVYMERTVISSDVTPMMASFHLGAWHFGFCFRSVEDAIMFKMRWQ